MAKYSLDQVRSHIKEHHPGCPDFAVRYFAQEVSRRRWPGANLGQAVGITIQNVLRHELTDDDQLLLVGVERVEARRRVQSRVNEMINQWKALEARNDG